MKQIPIYLLLLIILTAGLMAYRSFNDTLLKQSVQTELLTVRVGQFQQQMPELAQMIRRMNIPVKRVAEVRQTVVNTRSEVKTLLRDSVVNDTVRLRVFNYIDRYLQLHGIADADTQRIRVRINDTIIQVVHRGRRLHPWLWIFSRRELVQSIRMANPDARVVYDRVVRVE